MRVETKLQVCAADVYNYLTEQVLDDIEQTTKVRMSDEALDQFSYVKKIRVSRTSYLALNITIGPLVRNEYYRLSYSSKKGESEHYYMINELSDQTCYVVYVEENRLKNRLDQWFYRKSYARKAEAIEMRTIARLLAIENTIKEKGKRIQP